MSSLQFLISRYGAFPARYYSGSVQWSHWDLLFIHRGELILNLDRVDRRVKQGETVLIPPDFSFSLTNPGTTVTASVQYFMPEENSPLARKLSSLKKPLTGSSSDLINLESHIQELLNLYTPEEKITRRQELLLELAVEKILSGCGRKTENTLVWDRIIDKYRDNTYEIPSMEKLAREAGYSPGRFRVLFQRHTGISPARFFLNLRMEQSARLLRETMLPVKIIAYRCGYKELSHFTRAFSNHFSQSPARYRKSNLFRG